MILVSSPELAYYLPLMEIVCYNYVMVRNVLLFKTVHIIYIFKQSDAPVVLGVFLGINN